MFPAPPGHCLKFRRNMARAAENDKKTIYDSGGYMTEEKWDKAWKVRTIGTVGAAALPVVLAGAGYVAATGGAGALAAGVARAGGALGASASRVGKSLLSRAGNLSVEHPVLYTTAESIADAKTPLPPTTTTGTAVASALKTKELIGNHAYPWDD